MADRPLVTQPDATPTRKVAATGITGVALGALVVVATAAGIDVPGIDPDSVADALGPALALLVPSLVGYLTRERR